MWQVCVQMTDRHTELVRARCMLHAHAPWNVGVLSVIILPSTPIACASQCAATIAGGCFFGFATPGMLGSCVSAFFVAAFFGSAAVPVASRRRVLAPSDSAAALADSRSNSELRPPPPPAAAALAAIKTAAAAAAATPHPHCTA
jgi:hypothetical protein